MYRTALIATLTVSAWGLIGAAENPGAPAGILGYSTPAGGDHRGSTAEMHDAIARVAAAVVNHYGGDVDVTGLN